MNWYKIAQSNFPTWLGEKLREETNEYKEIRKNSFPKFNRNQIKLLRLWNEQTNPNLDQYSLKEAEKKSEEWYVNLPPSNSLTEQNIDIDGIIDALLSTMQYVVLGNRNVNKDDIHIKNITPVLEGEHQNLTNYIVTINFKEIKSPKYTKDEIKILEGKLSTKDGKYFTLIETRDPNYIPISELIDKIDLNSIEVDGIDNRDAPDYCDAYISQAYFENGTKLTEEQLDDLNDNHSDFVYIALMKELN